MKHITLLASLFFSSTLLAVENRSTTCQFGEKQRIIEVVYPEMTVTPCEVRYTKNDQTQVLWSANAELGYCESKAEAFIEKQKGWGWQCESEMSTSESINSVETTIDAAEEVSDSVEEAVEAEEVETK